MRISLPSPPVTLPVPVAPAPCPRRSSRRGLLAGAAIVTLLVLGLLPGAGGAAATGGSLLISPFELAALPISGAAWDRLVEDAGGDIGSANLGDQDNKHAVRTLGVALVAARTGSETLRGKARDAIMSAIGTEGGSHNPALALGRQLGAYVMAADVIGLSGSDASTFRSWLGPVRTRILGGHSRWDSLVHTHEDSANNWGAFAGASRIAASIYLGDAADVARAASVLGGFLGDRGAYAGFRPLDGEDATWACEPDTYTPVNPPCTKDGIDVNGAIVSDIARGGSLRWPPGESGISYTQEALQGLVVQAELLSRAGYPTWVWSDRALLRVARLVSEFDGWNTSSVTYHVPWLLNRRYGLSLPLKAAGSGRVFGYTDWLYGPHSAVAPAPTPKPTAIATAKPTPRPSEVTPAPVPTSTGTSDAGPVSGSSGPTPGPTIVDALGPSPTAPAGAPSGGPDGTHASPGASAGAPVAAVEGDGPSPAPASRAGGLWAGLIFTLFMALAVLGGSFLAVRRKRRRP